MINFFLNKATKRAKISVIFGALLISAFGLTAGPALAEEMKIATVDLQKAIQTVDAGKKAKAQLEKDYNTKKKDLEAEETHLRKMIEEFKKQSLVMSDEARAKKQAELQERGLKFEELKQRSTMDLQQKEQELTRPLVTKLRGVISDLAKQKGYTLILEKNENTVLFSLDKDDLTDDVISTFNKQQAKTS